MVNEPGVQELVSIEVEGSDGVLDGHRLNLIIPALSFAHSFGGISTALRLMHRLTAQFEAVRIIVTHQGDSEIDLQEWADWKPDTNEIMPRTIVGIPGRTKPLAVIAHDLFLATAWMTALLARQLIKRQAEIFPNANPRFVYFIQDYETGFYPWSVQAYYADSTYRNTHDTIVVFNTGRLQHYFQNNGVHFSKEYVLEPLMHPQLRESRRKSLGNVKERLIFVYARPNFPRNGFELIIDSLRLWAAEYPLAGDWSVISFGDRHDEIALPGSSAMRSIGKVSMHEYGGYLSRCWIGLSLQFMAHPSYSRLEMADFGSWVITNKLKNNDLSDVAPNILCVEEPAARLIADKLSWCCTQYRPGLAAALDRLVPIFKEREDEFPLASELVEAWHHG